MINVCLSGVHRLLHSLCAHAIRIVLFSLKRPVSPPVSFSSYSGTALFSLPCAL